MRTNEVIVDALYEAALVPETWPTALEGLAREVGAFGAAIVASVAASNWKYVATEGYKPTYEAMAPSFTRLENPRVQRAIARQYYGFLPDLDLCTQDELDADPIYREFLYPYGLAWTVGTPIPMPTGDVGMYDLCQRRELGPFTADQVALLDAYRPHLARAALLSLRLGMVRLRTVSEVLSGLRLPGGVISETGRVLSCNEELIALAPQITSQSGDRIAFRDRRLAETFVAALADVGMGVARSIPVRAVEGHPPLVLHVVPLRGAAFDVFTAGTAIVVATSVVQRAQPLASLLSGLFDLTPAEARVASGIANGGSIGAIAAQWGVSRETVRSQLKVVMDKSGLRRQSDLARLLQSQILFD
ncbi:MAG: LuxR family transcriptional regulator [Alphaproteobacteria bacterium]|nr:MAG: LuxR family transcriptional regulator [Alphaproteobacteria bacterium]